MFFLTVWLGATVIFIIPRLAPGDPVDAIVGRLMAEGSNLENGELLVQAWRQRFGLDEPLYVQYFRYLGNTLRLDTGYSLAFFPSRVDDMVKRAMPWTLGLLAVATLLSFVLGNLVGALLAWRGTPNAIRWLLPFSMTFTAIPAFMPGLAANLGSLFRPGLVPLCRRL